WILIAGSYGTSCSSATIWITSGPNMGPSSFLDSRMGMFIPFVNYCATTLKSAWFLAASSRAQTGSEWAWAFRPNLYKQPCPNWSAVWRVTAHHCKSALRSAHVSLRLTLVDAPFTCSAAGDKQRDKTINHCPLSAVVNR